MALNWPFAGEGEAKHLAICVLVLLEGSMTVGCIGSYRSFLFNGETPVSCVVVLVPTGSTLAFV